MSVTFRPVSAKVNAPAAAQAKPSIKHPKVKYTFGTPSPQEIAVHKAMLKRMDDEHAAEYAASYVIDRENGRREAALTLHLTRALPHYHKELTASFMEAPVLAALSAEPFVPLALPPPVLQYLDSQVPVLPAVTAPLATAPGTAFNPMNPNGNAAATISAAPVNAGTAVPLPAVTATSATAPGAAFNPMNPNGNAAATISAAPVNAGTSDHTAAHHAAARIAKTKTNHKSYKAIKKAVHASLFGNATNAPPHAHRNFRPQLTSLSTSHAPKLQTNVVPVRFQRRHHLTPIDKKGK